MRRAFTESIQFQTFDVVTFIGDNKTGVDKSRTLAEALRAGAGTQDSRRAVVGMAGLRQDIRPVAESGNRVLAAVGTRILVLQQPACRRTVHTLVGKRHTPALADIHILGQVEHMLLQEVPGLGVHLHLEHVELGRLSELLQVVVVVVPASPLSSLELGRVVSVAAQALQESAAEAWVELYVLPRDKTEAAPTRSQAATRCAVACP